MAKRPPGHAQALHLLLHAGGKRCGRGLAQAAQFFGFFLVMPGVGGQFVAQASDRFVVGVQRLQFVEQALLQVGQFGGLDPVLARQGINDVQALLDLLLAIGIGIEVVDEAVQFADRLLDLDLRAGQQVDRFAESGGLAAERGQAVEAGIERGKDVAGIALAAHFHDLAAGGEQAFGVAQGLLLLLQAFQFVFAEGQVFQFFQLVAEQLVAGALFVAATRQAFEFLAGLLPALRGELHLARQLLAAGVLVEQAPVGLALQQRLVLVLAMDVDQQFAQALQVAQRAGRAVDVGTRATFGSDHPAQDARTVLFQVALGEPVAGLGDGTDVEAGENVGLVRSGTYRAAVGAVAEGKAEGVEHDRLARTGFAGDHAHAGSEFEIQVLDDGVVVNGQVNQHGGRLRGFCLVIYTVFFPAGNCRSPLEPWKAVPI